MTCSRSSSGLKAQGKAILFISHKFDEVYEIADNYAVFRDGKAVGSGALAGVATGRDRPLMVGRSIEHAFPKVDIPLGETVLSVENYTHPTEFRDITFALRKGEIFGIYGLVGAGRSEICQSLFGVTKPSGGTLKLDGKEIAIHSPQRCHQSRHRLRAGGTRPPWRGAADARSIRTCRCPR